MTGRKIFAGARERYLKIMNLDFQKSAGAGRHCGCIQIFAWFEE